jgi:DNA-binding NtrC family response regulator
MVNSIAYPKKWHEFSPKKDCRRPFLILETETERQEEIREALKQHPNWNLRFFQSPEDCLGALHEKPMAILLDIEHFTKSPQDSAGLKLIGQLHHHSPDSEILVFCDSTNVHEAARILEMGALDYIVLNQHQYARLESEMVWLEGVLQQRLEDRKMKRFLLLLSIGLTLIVVVLFYLGYKGLIREGSSPDILIGD